MENSAAAGKDEISTTIAWQQSLVLNGASVNRRMPRPSFTHRSVGERVCSHSRVPETAVASVASAASAGRVSAAVAVSVAGAAAPFVAVLPGWPVAWLPADAPAPASAGAFAGPVAALPAASPAAAGISGPFLRFPCLTGPGDLCAAGHSDGSPVAKHYSPAGERCFRVAEHCSPVAAPVYTARQLPWSSPRRCP